MHPSSEGPTALSARFSGSAARFGPIVPLVPQPRSRCRLLTPPSLRVRLTAVAVLCTGLHSAPLGKCLWSNCLRRLSAGTEGQARRPERERCPVCGVGRMRRRRIIGRRSQLCCRTRFAEYRLDAAYGRGWRRPHAHRAKAAERGGGSNAEGQGQNHRSSGSLLGTPHLPLSCGRENV